MKFNNIKKIIVLISMFAYSLSYAYISIYSATDSGYVSNKYNEELKRPIASLTKVMNVMVALDIIKEEKISLDEYVSIDENVLSIKETGILFKKGDKIKLTDLLKAELVYSANNAAYAVAYRLGGLDKFVARMNQKAKILNMKNTEFYTPAGLPTSYTNKPLDISTAKDLYILALESLKYNKMLEWSNSKFLEYNKIKYYNRNKILSKNGNYGLKTGYHSLSMYNMIGINKINDINLITVSLGDETEEGRFETQMKASIDFKNSLKLLVKKDGIYGDIKVKDSKEKKLSAKFSKDFYYINTDVIIKEIVYDLKGKIKVGDKVGEVQFYTYNNKYITKVDLLANTSTNKLNFFEKLLKKILKF